MPGLAAYFEAELPAYLGAYAFYLACGRRPRDGEALPRIDEPARIVVVPPAVAFGDAVEMAARVVLPSGELPFWGRPSERHPLNVPGPFWAAQTDGDAAQRVAPGHLSADACGLFVYRQPGSPAELGRLLAAAAAEPLHGIGAGGRHDVRDLRAFWAGRDRFREALAAAGVGGLEALMERELPDYLGRYAFLLERGRLPEPGQPLPGLETPPPGPRRPPRPAFTNRWSERHPLNVPGKFYGAETDTCGTGPPAAPENVACDAEHGQEFVFRQPRTAAELEGVLEAAATDPFDGYGADGDERWTAELVRAWWAGRDAVRAGWRAAGVPDAERQLDDEVPAWLRAYLFFLTEGRSPGPRDALPDL